MIFQICYIGARIWNNPNAAMRPHPFIRADLLYTVKLTLAATERVLYEKLSNSLQAKSRHHGK